MWRFFWLTVQIKYLGLPCTSGLLNFSWTPGIYLEDLYVREFARGNGIGEALLRRLARDTLEMEGGRLEWSVLNWNEPAIGFYKKLGAVPLNEWTMFRVTGENWRNWLNYDVE